MWQLWPAQLSATSFRGANCLLPSHLEAISPHTSREYSKEPVLHHLNAKCCMFQALPASAGIWPHLLTPREIPQSCLLWTHNSVRHFSLSPFPRVGKPWRALKRIMNNPPPHNKHQSQIQQAWKPKLQLSENCEMELHHWEQRLDKQIFGKEEHL